jgi:hypothetical protein
MDEFVAVQETGSEFDTASTVTSVDGPLCTLYRRADQVGKQSRHRFAMHDLA